MSSCVVEDLVAEQDDLDSSGSGVFGLLDISDTRKTVDHGVSGATGGRSGRKLRRPAGDKTHKSSESEAKISPSKPQQTSTGSRRQRRNLSADTEMDQISANIDELTESQHTTEKTSDNGAEVLDNQTNVAIGQTPSRGSQRITRCNSDLRAADSESLKGVAEHSNTVSDAALAGDLCTENE